MDKISIDKEELLNYQKLKLISELAPIKERIKQFENTKACTFQKFEQKIASENEDFVNWDDYIEWKAYNQKYNELKKQLSEIDHVTDIEIS